MAILAQRKIRSRVARAGRAVSTNRKRRRRRDTSSPNHVRSLFVSVLVTVVVQLEPAGPPEFRSLLLTGRRCHFLLQQLTRIATSAGNPETISRSTASRPAGTVTITKGRHRRPAADRRQFSKPSVRAPNPTRLEP